MMFFELILLELFAIANYSSTRLIVGKTLETFFSEFKRPTAFIFGMQQCLVVPYIYPANQASRVETDPPRDQEFPNTYNGKTL